MSFYQLAFGGGVNSTAMAIELIKRKAPLDLILFADTGGERPETYEFLGAFDDWLFDRGLPPITPVRFELVGKGPETLEQTCLKNKTLPSIAYGRKACSLKYKAEPQDKFLRSLPEVQRLWESGGKVTKYIGIDAGEAHRANRTEDEHFIYRYPLIEWDWARDECIAAIEQEGLPVPPKSSCYFCPNMKEWEIRQLKTNHPELFARALAMEQNAKPRLTSIKGLGRRFSWEDLGRAIDDQSEFDFSGVRDEMPCGCYDGEDAP